MSLSVLHHPACHAHDLPAEARGSSHVERPERLDAYRFGLEALDTEIEWRQAVPVETEVLGSVHTSDHVQRVEQACSQGRFLDADTYARPESWDAARAAAGAAIMIAQQAADGVPGIAMTRPPGHHATGNQAMGFCLFNNIALAAQALTHEHRTVAIVDIDVHHGNGTQELFFDRDDVLYVSLHQSPFYPGTGLAHETGTGAGEGFTVNLPVPEGTGHAGWLELIDRVVVPVLEAFSPDVLLISAGYDAHREDPVGGLELVAGTFHSALQRFQATVPNLGLILEGGYSLEALEACASATVAALVGAEDPVKETITEGVRPWGMLRSEVESFHAGRWPVNLQN